MNYRNKNTKKSILDSVKKNVISMERKNKDKLSQINSGEINQKEKDKKDAEMKIEEENTNENLKNSISCEKMNISCEDDFKKNGKWNDSFQNNIDNSYGDSYSTINSSNMENEKNKTKEKDVIDDLVRNEEEYTDEILENLLNEEKIVNIEINPNYFEFQHEINQKMRSILIDWLLDVHHKFNFKQETFYTTIYIIDTFLSKKFIQRKRFQLLGVTSLLISSKLNEIYIRRMNDYNWYF